MKELKDDTCEVKTRGERCSNPAVGIVFDNLLCCHQHRVYIYTSWAERLSEDIVLH